MVPALARASTNAAIQKRFASTFEISARCRYSRTSVGTKHAVITTLRKNVNADATGGSGVMNLHAHAQFHTYTQYTQYTHTHTHVRRIDCRAPRTQRSAVAKEGQRTSHEREHGHAG